MTDTHPLVERYVARLSEGLAGLTPSDRAEVLDEIRQHVAEAVAAGRPIDTVLDGLGPADTLARAYAVELAINPRREQAGGRTRNFLAVAGLLALTSIPTLVITVTLFSIGISFIISGVAVFVAGIMGIAGALPSWVHMDVSPHLAIAVGPPLFVLGVVAIIGLVWYVRWLGRTVRQVLPSRRQAPTGR